MSKIFFSLLVLITISSCSSAKRTPSSAPEIITVTKLSKMKAIEVLQMLKDHCCDGIFFEATDVSFWGKSDIQDLESFLGDNTPSAPSVNTISDVICRGERYISTTDREARHLIKAIQIGKYPLALCSTYDLKL